MHRSDEGKSKVREGDRAIDTRQRTSKSLERTREQEREGEETEKSSAFFARPSRQSTRIGRERESAKAAREVARD